jgi:hypothetical protein
MASSHVYSAITQQWLSLSVITSQYGYLDMCDEGAIKQHYY